MPTRASRCTTRRCCWAWCWRSSATRRVPVMTHDHAEDVALLDGAAIINLGPIGLIGCRSVGRFCSTLSPRLRPRRRRSHHHADPCGAQGGGPRNHRGLGGAALLQSFADERVPASRRGGASMRLPAALLDTPDDPSAGVCCAPRTTRSAGRRPRDSCRAGRCSPGLRTPDASVVDLRGGRCSRVRGHARPLPAAARMGALGMSLLEGLIAALPEEAAGGPGVRSGGGAGFVSGLAGAGTTRHWCSAHTSPAPRTRCSPRPPA